jgi:hypothetical protein
VGCISLATILQLLVYVVLIVAFVLIIQLLIARFLCALGEPVATAMAIIRIALWAVCVIFALYFAFDILSCVIGGVRIR